MTDDLSTDEPVVSAVSEGTREQDQENPYVSMYERANERLAEISGQLRDGNLVKPVTVRALLSWFGAQRRGSFIVYYIHRSLQANGLATRPDFESEWIDANVEFVLASNPSAPQEEVSIAPETPILVGGAIADPTHKVGKLDASNRGVVSVTPDDSITRAVTIMLAKNYSQLPIMTSEREVKGVISWASIGSRAALGKVCNWVRDCSEKAQEVSSDASLFSVIPHIAEHQYVLVRDAKDKRITGIVTASDLSVQFQQLAEPFLLLGEIEHQIRRLVQHRFTETELACTKDPGDAERKITSVADLTIGECIRLLENEDNWNRLGLAVDRVVFVRDLHKVRNIRNDVMHFDPDPLTADDLEELRSFVRFLETLWEIGVVQSPSVSHAATH